jgi:hypothetical protein
MQSFDPGALAMALSAIPAPHGASATWELGADDTEPFVHFCDQVRKISSSPPRTSSALVTDSTAELDATLDKHKLAPYFGKSEPGTGIITSTAGLQRFEVPLERVQVKGGDALRRAEPTDAVNYLLATSTSDPRVLVTQLGTRPVARLPLTDGKLWLVRSASVPGQTDLGVFNEAQAAINHVRDLRVRYDAEMLSKLTTERWSHVLWPLFAVQAKLEIDWLAGARRGDQRVSGAFQVLNITFDTRGAKQVRAPFAGPDEPQPLAFNGTTLVFKSGHRGRLEWLAKVTVGDWELRDK